MTAPADFEASGARPLWDYAEGLRRDLPAVYARSNRKRAQREEGGRPYTIDHQTRDPKLMLSEGLRTA